MTGPDAHDDHRLAMRRVLWAIFIASLVGGAFACTAATTTSSGDEPPIRVKNGSLDLWLLSKRNGWIRDGSSRNWKVPGERKSDDLTIEITVASGASCSLPLEQTGRKVEVHYSNDEVDFQSTGNHTKVTATQDFDFTNSQPQLLRYTAATDNYVSSIVVDGKTICTFTAKEQLQSLVILDF